MDNNVTAKQ